MKKRNTLKITIFIIFIILILNWTTISDLWKTNKPDITGEVTHETIPHENSTNAEVYFCPGHCEEELIAWLDVAEHSIHCAFYELGLENVKEKLIEKNSDIDVKLIVDNRNYDFVENLSFAIHDNRSALMHNKFCVIDSVVVWTGSFNPTKRGAYKNNNNAVVYQSAYMAKNYEDEFNEMWNGNFGKGNKVKYPKIVINEKEIETYFCPEDWCSNKLVYTLQEAEHTIDFMTFSFTHDEVGKQIIEQFKNGIKIRGVFEKSQNNKYLEKKKFEAIGIPVKWDGNKANMHHKVFIIDDKTVVTGSFNPSNNADKRNDENLIIIHDKNVTELFVKEFEKIWNEGAE